MCINEQSIPKEEIHHKADSRKVNKHDYMYIKVNKYYPVSTLYFSYYPMFIIQKV